MNSQYKYSSIPLLLMLLYTMAGKFLTSYFSPALNVYVEIWGFTTSVKGLRAHEVTDIYVKQKDGEVWFGGCRFDAYEAVGNIREAINKMKVDPALERTDVWTEYEYLWEVHLMRDGQGYNMGSIQHDGNMDKEQVKIENIDSFELLIDQVYDYLDVTESCSEGEGYDSD